MGRPLRQLGVILAVGCSSPNDGSEPPPAETVSLAPLQVNVGRDQSVQYQAFLDGRPASADQFIWSTTDSRLARVSSGGLLTTTACSPGGASTLRAALARDPSRQGTATALVVVPLVSLVQIQAIHGATDHQPVDLGRVAGAVDILILTEPAVLCGEITGIQLVIAGPSGDSLLPIQDWHPVLPGQAAITLRWDADVVADGRPTFPNGDYQVGAIVHGTTGMREASIRVPLKLVNAVRDESPVQTDSP